MGLLMQELLNQVFSFPESVHMPVQSVSCHVCLFVKCPHVKARIPTRAISACNYYTIEDLPFSHLILTTQEYYCFKRV